jgi:4-hydroxy-4-methyl-2-oxoglutarate aldolase
MILSSINAPIRTGRAAVLPGDVVLAKVREVNSIPPHLVAEAERKARRAEATRIR